MPRTRADDGREPPVYRPFALLALAATLGIGTPLGLWLLAWRYLGAPAVPIPWALLHAHVQIVGFFATLIPGVAPHLLARFTGRPVTAPSWTPAVLALLATALLLRVAGTWGEAAPAILFAALAEGAAFARLGVWVWRSLDAPPLATVRRHLTAATAWLALAALVEVAARATAPDALVPALGWLRASHAIAVLGGVVGWVLGVLLRAGPMFVPDWRVPPAVARAVPWALALGVTLVVAGEAVGLGPTSGLALARLGDALVYLTVAVLPLTAGALRRAPRALPLLSRSPAEARIVRLAAASALAAALAALAAAALAATGSPAPLLTDAARHLLTVGFLTSVAVAMAFRLVPVLEWAPLPWPALRSVAFWALLGAVVLRSAQVLVGAGVTAVAPAVGLSGLLAWIALAGLAANLVGAALARRRRG